jgi:hypothetical protein
MIIFHEWEVTSSKEEALDLLDVLNYGGKCEEDSIFSVESYGVNDMDVKIKYPESDELVVYNLRNEHIDHLIRLIEEQCNK